MPFKKLTTAPTTEPLTNAEVKTHGRIDGTAEDAYIDTLIEAARQLFERESGVSLVTQNWTVWYDTPPVRCGIADEWWDGVRDGARVETVVNHLDLPVYPIQSVAAVNSYGTDNAATVFASTNYFLDSVTQPGRLVLNQGSNWPTGLRAANALSIELVAGYGDNASDVPAEIRHALKMAVLHWYKTRGDCASQKQVDAALKIIAPTLHKFRQVRL